MSSVEKELEMKHYAWCLPECADSGVSLMVTLAAVSMELLQDMLTLTGHEGLKPGWPPLLPDVALCSRTGSWEAGLTPPSCLRAFQEDSAMCSLW